MSGTDEVILHVGMAIRLVSVTVMFPDGEERTFTDPLNLGRQLIAERDKPVGFEVFAFALRPAPSGFRSLALNLEFDGTPVALEVRYPENRVSDDILPNSLGFEWEDCDVYSPGLPRLYLVGTRAREAGKFFVNLANGGQGEILLLSSLGQGKLLPQAQYIALVLEGCEGAVACGTLETRVYSARQHHDDAGGCSDDQPRDSHGNYQHGGWRTAQSSD